MGCAGPIDGTEPTGAVNPATAQQGPKSRSVSRADPGTVGGSGLSACGAPEWRSAVARKSTPRRVSMP